MDASVFTARNKWGSTACPSNSSSDECIACTFLKVLFVVCAHAACCQHSSAQAAAPAAPGQQATMAICAALRLPRTINQLSAHCNSAVGVCQCACMGACKCSLPSAQPGRPRNKPSPRHTSLKPHRTPAHVPPLLQVCASARDCSLLSATITGYAQAKARPAPTKTTLPTCDVAVALGWVQWWWRFQADVCRHIYRELAVVLCCYVVPHTLPGVGPAGSHSG